MNTIYGRITAPIQSLPESCTEVHLFLVSLVYVCVFFSLGLLHGQLCKLILGTVELIKHIE